MELWWGIATGKARFQASHKIHVHENLQVILRWKDFPFTCDRKDLFCAKESMQNFVLVINLVINYMPPNQKKAVKWLVRGRNTSILGQNLWKQIEPTSLILNRYETVRDEKEWGLENSHMCSLKKDTLKPLKIIGGHMPPAPCPPSSDGPAHEIPLALSCLVLQIKISHKVLPCTLIMAFCQKFAHTGNTLS